METVLTPSSGDNATIDSGQPVISVVMPCLNEEKTIGRCIEKAQAGLAATGLSSEIIVSDNGSTDESVAICERYGVRVVHQAKRGYGNAYLKGMEAARGKYIVMADSDDTYDLREIDRFIDPLRRGFDLVMGNRFRGKILPGAMTWSHQYIGNPILSGLLRLLFGTTVGDSHSGIRAFTSEAYRKMALRSPGMEFASEMVINASKFGLRITEVPVTYYPREGETKLRTIRDGWRHLRYMLLRSPAHLFVLPGLAMLLVGIAGLVQFGYGPVNFEGHTFDIHGMFVVGLLALVGYQLVALGLCARMTAVREGLDIEGRWLQAFRKGFSVERGLLSAVTLVIAGVALGYPVLAKWLSSGLGVLALSDTRQAFLFFVVVILGVQTAFMSFFLVLIQGANEFGRPSEL